MVEKFEVQLNPPSRVCLVPDLFNVIGSNSVSDVSSDGPHYRMHPPSGPMAHGRCNSIRSLDCQLLETINGS